MTTSTLTPRTANDLDGLRSSWLIIITGFQQSRAALCGGELAWRACRHLSGRDIATPPPYTWKTNWNDLAAFIHRNSVAQPRIFTWAHSWGVDSTIDFMHALDNAHLRVELAWFVDGVHRSSLLPVWLPLNVLSTTILCNRGLRPRRLGGLTDIRVPSNVEQVKAWFQTNDPAVRGHFVVAEDEDATTVEQNEVQFTDHFSIDQNPALIQSFVAMLDKRLDTQRKETL